VCKDPIQLRRIPLLVLLVSCTHFILVVDPMLRLRRRNPSVLFALPHIELTCLVQQRSDEIRQPRYLALSTDSKVCPCRL
jgi:hypothetical protein